MRGLQIKGNLVGYEFLSLDDSLIECKEQPNQHKVVSSSVKNLVVLLEGGNENWEFLILILSMKLHRLSLFFVFLYVVSSDVLIKKSGVLPKDLGVGQWLSRVFTLVEVRHVQLALVLQWIVVVVQKVSEGWFAELPHIRAFQFWVNFDLKKFLEELP